MPRKPRYYLAGVPSSAPEDFRYYLQCLREACLSCEATIHAYVLMTNHVHLLITPGKVDSVSRVLQSVGRRYVQYVNVSYRRSGTLWEGRHKSSLIDSETYLMTCYRYIELNPVRAGVVTRPGDYPWSSYGANAHGRDDALTKPHDLYEALGRDPKSRQLAYRDIFRQQVDADHLQDLRTAINLCVPVGSDRFKLQVERRLKQRISYRPRGRPRKEPSSQE